MIEAVGVDLGGSQLRAAWRDSRGILRRASAPAPLKNELSAALKKMIGAPAKRLAIGSRGVWEPSERRALRRALSGVCGSVLVMPDLELSWLAALGGAPGVVVTAGTGSVCFGKNSSGAAARTGGLGPLIGDEGSGFWLGRQWLKTRPDPEQRSYAVRPDAVRAIAALAPKAMKKFSTPAAEALADIAVRCAVKLRLKAPIPLSWQGGLFSSKEFQKSFVRSLGPSFAPRPPLEAPDLAALKLLLG